MASLGAKVLQVRSVELAMCTSQDLCAVVVRRSRSPNPDPHCDEEDIVEQQVVTGIAYSKDEAQITLRHVPESRASPRPSSCRWPRPTSMSTMIVQTSRRTASRPTLTFTVPQAEFQARKDVIDKARAVVGCDTVEAATDVPRSR